MKTALLQEREVNETYCLFFSLSRNPVLLLESKERKETQKYSFSTSPFGFEMQALDVTEEKCPSLFIWLRILPNEIEEEAKGGVVAP